MTDIDTLIDESHRRAEEIEHTARQIEARVCRIPGADRHLPLRRYGSPIEPAAYARNLTLRGLINRSDPALAAYLNIQDGSHRQREEAAAARQMKMQSLSMQTDRLRRANAEAARRREQMELRGFNPNTGRRWGQ